MARRGAAFAVLLVVLLAAGALLGSWLGRQTSPAFVETFEFATLDGERIGPRQLAGQVIVVEFWASWCGPCRAQKKIIAPLVEEMADRNVAFLAVNIGETREQVVAYMEENPIPYPVLLDEAAESAERGGIVVLPHTVLLDGNGQQIAAWDGIVGRSALRESIESALGDGARTPVATSSG